MKKNLLFLALFLSFLTGAISQELFAEFPPIQKLFNRPFSDNIMVAHHEDGGMNICYFHSGQFFVYQVDTDGKLAGQASLSSDNFGFSSKGVVQTDSSDLFLFYEGGYITVVEAGKNDVTSLKVLDVKLMDKKDKLIGMLSSGNEFYMTSWNKKEGNIRLARFNSSTYSFDNKLYAVEDDLGSDMARGHLEVITDADLPEPSTAKESRKMYLVGKNRVFITLDGRSDTHYQTLVVELDWNASKLGQYLLGNRAVNVGMSSPSNSYIYGHQLTWIWLDPGGFSLEVFDLDKPIEKSQPIQAYFFTPDDTLMIMNSPLFVESDNFWVDDKAYSKENTKKVLSKLAKGWPFVYIEPAGHHLAYTIGNYIERSGGSGFSPGMPSSSFGAGTGGAPGHWNYGGSYKTSRFFFSLLDRQTLEPEEGNISGHKITTQGYKKFTDNYLTHSSALFLDFSNDLTNHVSLVPGNQQQAVLISYLKKEGKIKVFKVDLLKVK